MIKKKGIVLKDKDNCRERGYIFIQSNCLKNESIFAHISDFKTGILPEANEEVEFVLEYSDRGPCAKEIVNLTMQQNVNPFSTLKNIAIKESKPPDNRPKEKVDGKILELKPKEKKIIPNIKINPGYHFYVVFDPTLNEGEDKELDGITQAHSFNNLIKRSKKNENFYWGKYKASKGNAELIYENFLSAKKANSESNCSTILYISDYQSFWAAKVENVHKSLDFESKKDFTLEFYRKNWDKIELWFEISDMVLISTNSVETSKFIKSLGIRKCNNYNSMSISNDLLNITPYTCNLRYPLIIENMNFVDYFSDNSVRQVDIENPLLTDSNSAEKIETIVKSYLIPNDIYEKIPFSIHRELIQAESKYLELKTKSAMCRYNLKIEIAVDYLRILEMCLKDLLINQCKYPGLVKNRFTLGSFNIFLSDIPFKLKSSLPEFYQSLIATNKFLTKELLDIRNGKAHGDNLNTSEEHLDEIRMNIIGIGCDGILNLLYKSFYNIEISANKNHYKLSA